MTNDEEALLDACRHGKLSVVKKLLGKGTKLVLDSWHQTGLHLASIDGHLEVAKLLLARGVDPNARDKSQATALTTAAGMFAKLPYFELLLAHGADVTVISRRFDDAKQTVLDVLFAREPLRLSVAKLLIAKGAPASPDQRRQVGGAAAQATKQKSLLASFDWPALETHLVTAATKAIARFAKAHADELFCGFCFDCNAEAHAQVLFCFETEANYKAYARKRAGKELRWSPGNWAYQEFGSMDRDRAWRARVKRLGGEDGIEREVADRLLESCSRAAHQLAKTGAFDALRRTADFDVFAIDHDETPQAAQTRMVRVRAKAGKKAKRPPRRPRNA